jgi:hypothetical protein
LVCQPQLGHIFRRKPTHMSVEGHQRERIIAVERQLLAALCQGLLDQGRGEELLRRLEKHAFALPDHEVIFRALRKLPPIRPGLLREALAVMVTRMGFPDADLEVYFEAYALAEENLDGLLRELQYPSL